MALFSDPALRTRQTNLNSQWFALNDTIDNCQLTPSSGPAFSQFYADFAGWKDFYASESDYTSASKHATDTWQSKLQDYTRKIAEYCNSSAGGESPYIPGVKDPPPDEAGVFDGFLDKAGDQINRPFAFLGDLVDKITIGVVILLVTIVAIVGYVLAKRNVNVAGVGGIS